MKIFVTGGGGYVGAQLIPALLKEGHTVKVLDLFLYGEDVFDGIEDRSNLTCVKGDIRDRNLLREHLAGMETVIHLACISNDPSFELNPELGKSINLDAFHPLVEASKEAGVKRFIYASSSSVYGIKEEARVTEEMDLQPLTDYSRFKAECEKILLDAQEKNFTICVLRPATVCGYSPRQRLDVIVNIMTNLAYHTGTVKIFGGEQKRPNIHITDMVRAYLHVLQQPDEKIAGKIYNVGSENHQVKEIARIVREAVGTDQKGSPVKEEVVQTDDNRSYHIYSGKIEDELGFRTRFGLEEAVADLRQAFAAGKLQDPMNNIRYYNIRMMQHVELK